MINFNQKNLVFVICLFLVTSVMGLWSWNTLAELLSLPEAQYKHALAAFFLLVILRLALTSSHCNFDRLTGSKHVDAHH